MSRTNLPILPVAGQVVFPGRRLRVSLTNFTERICHSVSRGKKIKMFGIVAYRDPARKAIYEYGTIVGVLSEEPTFSSNPHPVADNVISSFFSMPRGSQSRHEWQLVVVGVDRFRILSASDEGGFLYGSVEVLKDKPSAPLPQLLDKLRAAGLQFFRTLSVTPAVMREYQSYRRIGKLTEEQDLAALGFHVASYLDAGVAQKQELLEMFDLEGRTKKLIELLEASLAVRTMQSDSVALEVERKVREAQPRPRFLLGQMPPQANEEMDKFQKQLDALTLSEDTKTYLQRELNRLKTMPSHHMEHNVLRNYMETALALPWNASTSDNYDLDRARTQLDSDHFGLQQVKRRIIEFLAVRGLKKDMKGFIICFHGPPGVGKTSLGKSIADSLGRKFHRISLGGVRDEAEIRGHRRTYVGALPGVFIHALRKCGSNNPVILLDEIDKVGKDMMRGDPASALLEVLDPAQNHSFTDHYMAIPFDLSNVLFIATANHLETIPAPLLDRMEMLHISGYSTIEKLQIAKAHLAPRQIVENALTPEQLEFQDDTILNLINGYTREAGVRQLERVLGSVCRAVAVDLSAHKKGSAEAQFPKRVVKAEELEIILGNSLYENDLEDRVNVPGVALGLAWTPFGGRVMVVETSKSVGTGRLRITGQLGDVMKESVLTALTWIKTQLGAVLPLPSSHAAEGLDGLDIHIHVPAAAVPKDGPSAGVTITTALVSLLTDIRVRSDTAMTGEISLKGLVLPVGGVKEKVLAAHRLGIKRIILPAKNKKDLKDLPANVIKEVTFIPVTSLHEVLIQSLESPDAITSILKPPILPAKL